MLLVTLATAVPASSFFVVTSRPNLYLLLLIHATRACLLSANMASPQFLELSRQLLHPPTHPNHVVSLYSSLLAIRRCLNLEARTNQQGFEGALSIESTCAAWILMAEIGLSVLAAGLGGQDGPDWARGISGEVERAISEGLKLSSTARVGVSPTSALKPLMLTRILLICSLRVL